MPLYEFRKLTRADYPLLRRWLALPHVRAWWGDPEHEISLIEQDMNTGPTDMRLVHFAGMPFAYVQDYPAHHWPMPQYDDFPPTSRALDMFLGEPSFLRQGHAKCFLRQRAGELRTAGAASVLVDPDINNKDAIATYKAAGFVAIGNRICEEGDLVTILQYQ